MRAKLDENLPVEAAELLRAAGWNCDTVQDEGLAGAEDARVAAACQADARVLFTLDLDLRTSGRIRRAITQASWCFGRTSPPADRYLA